MALVLSDIVERPFDKAHLPIIVALFSFVMLVGSLVLLPILMPQSLSNTWDKLRGFVRFFYASFLKPHSGDHDGSQQSALESFYKAQVFLYHPLLLPSHTR